MKCLLPIFAEGQAAERALRTLERDASWLERLRAAERALAPNALLVVTDRGASAALSAGALRVDAPPSEDRSEGALPPGARHAIRCALRTGAIEAGEVVAVLDHRQLLSCPSALLESRECLRESGARAVVAIAFAADNPAQLEVGHRLDEFEMLLRIDPELAPDESVQMRIAASDLPDLDALLYSVPTAFPWDLHDPYGRALDGRLLCTSLDGVPVAALELDALAELLRARPDDVAFELTYAVDRQRARAVWRGEDARRLRSAGALAAPFGRRASAWSALILRGERGAPELFLREDAIGPGGRLAIWPVEGERVCGEQLAFLEMGELGALERRSIGNHTFAGPILEVPARLAGVALAVSRVDGHSADYARLVELDEEPLDLDLDRGVRIDPSSGEPIMGRQTLPPYFEPTGVLAVGLAERLVTLDTREAAQDVGGGRLRLDDAIQADLRFQKMCWDHRSSGAGSR